MSELRSKPKDSGPAISDHAAVTMKTPRKSTSPRTPVGSDDWRRHPELYMKDGTMVLLAGSTVFRVYPGLLAMHSEVFSGMTVLSDHLPEEMEVYDGCALVRLTDEPDDLAHFLRAIMGVKYVIM